MKFPWVPGTTKRLVSVAMATSIKSFHIELYQEYLEDASFLYEQRLSLFDNPEITWLDIEDFEDRFEPHIDGLIVGGELALEVCKQRAAEGDSGELHAAARVFCRQNRKDLLFDVLQQLDPDDGEKMAAVCDALKYELPHGWENELIFMMHGGNPKMTPLISTIMGYRRLDAGKELIQALKQTDSNPLSDIIWALGRLRFQEARPLLLEKYLRDQDESVCIYTALALLRMGETQAVNHCLQSAGSQDWPNTLLGISSGRFAVSLLLKKASSEKAATNCLLGLGLLGDISAVETLLVRLADPESAESSALALNLITGANIFEQVFIPEEIDEDELFPEELEKFKQGQVPTRLDGKPFGDIVTRLSQKSEDWHDWWSKNRSRFNPDIRYRGGRPFSPSCLLENMEHGKTQFRIRQLAYEELVIRYGQDFPFEADLTVSRQKQVLANISQWVKSNDTRFKEGVWYFAGQQISQ